MEIWNTGTARGNGDDVDAAYWDDVLGMGNLLYGVATDDNHGINGSCGGWVRVRAENNINAILQALKNGAFYSSCGPEIYDFYVDEVKEKAYIECSGAAKIRLHCDGHPTLIKRSAEGNLTRAEFDLRDWTGTYDYARITVIDKDGKYAWTNPIFIK